MTASCAGEEIAAMTFISFPLHVLEEGLKALAIVCLDPSFAENLGRQKAGDCSQDSSVDISDAICLLGYLFTGRPTLLPCGTGSSADVANLELLDLNGDQRLDLSDPVHLLGFLFLGTPPPFQGLDCREMPECPARCL